MVDLEFLIVNDREVGLGLMTETGPGRGSLHGFACGLARLNLGDMTAIGQVNDTLELIGHGSYLSFFDVYIITYFCGFVNRFL
jgi:hypothetical protein